MFTALKTALLRSAGAFALLMAMAWSLGGTAVAIPSTVPANLDGRAAYQSLCDALENIKGQKLSQKNCGKNFDTQKQQNQAVDNICSSKYKNKLQNKCDAYQTALSQAATQGSGSAGSYSLGSSNAPYSCGGPGQKIDTAINFGCEHKGPALLDLAFAIIRFLSDGAGLVIVASMVWAGIQYTMSRGDPQATASAVGRIQSNVVALFIFLFAYAILNYLIPGQFLQ